MSYNFKIPEYPELNFLNSEDLHFFYYDIESFNGYGISDPDSWETVLREFKGKVDISSCKRAEMPNSVELNTIRFSCKKGDEIYGFFRHLRNAFSHHRIYRINDIIYLKDIDINNGSKLTMLGKIDAKLLKEICFRFIDIDQEIREKYQESVYSEIS